MLFLAHRAQRDFLEGCADLREGSLRLITPEGERLDFGQGTPASEMQIRDWEAVASIGAHGVAGLEETYAAGLWDTPSIESLVQVLLNCGGLSEPARPASLTRFKSGTAAGLLSRNPLRGATPSLAAHRSAGNEFYQEWLDRGMAYSAALFAEGDDDLERAQTRKYDRILNRLGPGERVLEIGCGWGGFAERAAWAGRQVTGTTASPGQHGYADARLDGRAAIQLCGYRRTSGSYDNVVSIEPAEAAGARHWPSYFATLKARLAEGGRAVVQAITVPDSPAGIARSGTFPPGMILPEAALPNLARKAGLRVEDSYAFGADYARTCRAWSARTQARAPRLGQLGFDTPFLRSWRYRLEAGAAAFATGRANVVQVELAHA